MVQTVTPAAPTPEVAVVVPSYRRAELLPRLVHAIEDQTLDRSRFEVIVVDNGSDDNTPEVLGGLVARSPLDLRPLRIETNRGPAMARNLGWQSAAAPFIAFLDDDCVPEPGWLAAGVEKLRADDRVGVVQGCVRRPDGTRLGDWTLFREVLGPTPYFEGCNIFVRRAALESTGGFDEDIGWYGEDTALGWSVVTSGWERDFAPGAVVYHDVVERGLRWHIRNGYLQGNFVGLARRFPDFEREAFWRPWAFQRHEPLAALAAAGVALSVWKRTTLLLALPWVWARRPPNRHHRWAALLAERAAVDAGVLAGMLVASVRERRLVL